MDAATSLKNIFLTSRSLGFFPFSLNRRSDGTTEFIVSKKHLTYSKGLLFVSFLVQTYLTWFLRFVSMQLATEKSSKTVLTITTLSIPTAISLLFHTVLRKSVAFCSWLNKIQDLFSDLGESHLKKVKLFYWCSFAFAISSTVIACIFEFYVRPNLGEPKTFFHRCEVMMCLYYFLVCEIELFVQIFLLFLHLLHCSYEETRRIFQTGGNQPDKNFWITSLRELRLRDLELADFLNFLQDYFTPVMSLHLIWAFSTTLFNVTLGARYGVAPAIQLIWAIYISLALVKIIAVCHYTEEEVQKVPHYLHAFFISCNDRELRKEVELFSLQIQHTKMDLNVLGFHKMNFTLLHTMIASLTSYTVILLQFRDTSIERSITNQTIII